jgi:cyclohexanecarboxylate-CoA ligase
MPSNPPLLTASPTFDPEGWFDTGDMAYMDDEGYIRIDGRIKDIIIRGGENVPVFDIENLLFKHPAVRQFRSSAPRKEFFARCEEVRLALSAAIVGYPDARLGERACAFLVLRPGHSLDLASVQTLMAEHKVAKQYWPERVETVADLPKTPAGKVQKYQLRETAKAFAEATRAANG